MCTNAVALLSEPVVSSPAGGRTLYGGVFAQRRLLPCGSRTVAKKSAGFAAALRSVSLEYVCCRVTHSGNETPGKRLNDATNFVSTKE